MKLNDPKTYALGLMLVSCLAGTIGRADDSLSALMQRMKSDQAVRVAYQETRTLELMEKPWKGSGYMYSLPPDLMLKEQLKPERLLMGVKGDKMFYFDPVNNVRHQGEMDQDNPVSLSIAVFKALMNADEAALHSMYRVEFSSLAQGWTMRLKDKQDSESGFSIDITGLPQQPADAIKVRQADGESSVFTLRQDAEGDEVKATVTRLYQELLGQ